VSGPAGHRRPWWRPAVPWREVLAPAIVVAVGAWLYAPLLWGDLPIDHDHPMMLLRAWMTGRQLATGGLPNGFSPILFAGGPADGMYPVGADLLVVLFRVVTLGLASWETAYCWSLLVAILAGPLAMYALGRRLAGPLAGLVAGVLAVVEHGSYLQGGWEFTVEWGVWAMGLSFALCLWALQALDRLADSPGRGRLASLAAFVGGALVCHPMALPILGLAVPIQLGWTVACRGGRAARAWLPSAALAFAIGGGLACFWYVPFLAHGDWVLPLGREWRGLDDTAAGLLDGAILDSFAPAFAILGIAGLLWAAARRGVLAGATLLAAVAALVVSSTTFLLATGALAKLPSLANLQLERFSYLPRAALLLGTGVFAGLLFAEVRRRAIDPGDGEARGLLARAAKVAMVGLVVAPFLVIAWPPRAAGYFVPPERQEYASGGNRLESLKDAAAALSRLGPAEVGRVALQADKNEHLLMLLPVYTGLPVFKLGFTPENNSRYKPEEADGELRAALGISHVLSIGRAAGEGLDEAGRFGDLRLYRVRGYLRRLVYVRGEGTAEVLREAPGAIDVRLSGTGPASTADVRVGNFALWRAELDGEPVAIEGASAGDGPPMFVRVPARDGLLTLRYRAGLAEWAGVAATLASVTGLAFVLALMRSVRLRGWWEARTRRWRGPVARGVARASGGLAAAAVVGGGLVLAIPGPRSVNGHEVVADASRLLDRGWAEIARESGPERCEPWNGERFQCPRAHWNYVGRTAQTSGGLVRDCVWMHPVDEGRLTLHLPVFPLGDRLEGGFGLSDAAAAIRHGASVRLGVRVGKGEPAWFTAPPDKGWLAWSLDTPGRDGDATDLTIEVETANDGGRHFCFTAYSTR
jgi:hypothetical protein